MPRLRLPPASRRRIGAALLPLLLGAACVHATDAPAPAHAAIVQVLETYRTAVSTGDEALFATTLLDDDIPFHAVRAPGEVDPALDSRATRGVAAFRQSVFHGGRRYRQHFTDIRVAQDGALAQATLRFVTLRDDGSGGAGWKTLTLIDVGGRWKIASEFYTVGDATDADRSAAAQASTP